MSAFKRAKPAMQGKKTKFLSWRFPSKYPLNGRRRSAALSVYSSERLLLLHARTYGYCLKRADDKTIQDRKE